MGTFTGTLDFAIQREEQAYDFYTTLARKVTAEEMRLALISFAKEELKHKATLSAIKRQKVKPPDEKIRDLQISDYVTDVEPRPEMTYKDALIIAMKKETNSFRLYRDLAAIIVDEDLRNTFLTLAQEEAKQKLRFETEYENTVPKGNP
jgi:rubrerythrin